MDVENVEEDRKRAEVFDALSHPTRIMLLKALSDEPLGFADLKKKLGIESSGHLQHHISKLGGLIKTDDYGKYTLSDQGKDALHSVDTVESVARVKASENEQLRFTEEHCFEVDSDNSRCSFSSKLSDDSIPVQQCFIFTE